MPWQVTGLRDKRYRVETPDQVSAWVADEIDTMTHGWMPLASEREADGSMRVTYGMLPPALRDTPRPAIPAAPVIGGTTGDAVLAGLAMLLAVVGIATAFGLLPHP
jgi:hypothetical protein